MLLLADGLSLGANLHGEKDAVEWFKTSFDRFLIGQRFGIQGSPREASLFQRIDVWVQDARPTVTGASSLSTAQ